MSQQITTISFFKFSSIGQKLWAFGMMQFAHSKLKSTNGLQFYKLLGTGKSNFNPLPDLSVYAILQTWDHHLAAQEFFDNSPLFNNYKQHSEQYIIFYLQNLISHGLWSGSNPFVSNDNIPYDYKYIAVITRAKIKPTMLRRFWNYVPKAQQDLINNPNLLFAAGIGERPITQMATFSLWDNVQAIKQFAYRNKHHRLAIQQTQAMQWYSEELFARFIPYKIVGQWKGFEIPNVLK